MWKIEVFQRTSSPSLILNQSFKVVFRCDLKSKSSPGGQNLKGIYIKFLSNKQFVRQPSCLHTSISAAGNLIKSYKFDQQYLNMLLNNVQCRLCILICVLIICIFIFSSKSEIAPTITPLRGFFLNLS